MYRGDPNRARLELIAGAVGDLRERLVFVGGAVAGLLVTDPLAHAVRATVDVDAVVDAGLGGFHRIEAGIAACGFVRDVDSGVICRWRHRASDVVFDLMPVQPEVLGFSNRWYPYAVATAQAVRLAPGVEVRMASAVAFVATKLEAFESRGRGDVLASHDLEDVLNIVDGRAELAQELADAPAALRQAVAASIAPLLGSPDFINALPGLIAEPDRAPIITERLRKLAQ